MGTTTTTMTNAGIGRNGGGSTLGSTADVTSGSREDVTSPSRLNDRHLSRDKHPATTTTTTATTTARERKTESVTYIGDRKNEAMMRNEKRMYKKEELYFLLRHETKMIMKKK